MTQNKYIAMLGMLLFVATSLAQNVSDIEKIKLFYVRYMEAIENRNHETEEALVQNFLTKEMQDKKRRLVNATDTDPLLRAQDVSDFGRQSLQCRHLEGGWYMVSYRWDEKDSVGTHIPIKIVKDVDGQPRIGYVTPYCAREGYGDRIFDISEIDVVDRKGGYKFVESFFKAYVYPYVKLTSPLRLCLERLRRTYCTPDMQKKYVAMSQMFLEDASPMDPLVGCADFDAFWYSSIKVAPIGKNLFEVSYNTGDGIICVKLAVKRQNGKWRICDLRID